MTFKDAEWNERFKKLGDEAERRFAEWADRSNLGWVKYGLDRPPLRLYELPTRIRHTPDFLMSRRFVEAQGLGKDQTFKLKVTKHGCLRWWNDVHPVWVFVWDSFYERHTFVTLDDIDNAWAEHGDKGRFPEGHAYFSIPADALWTLGKDAPA